MTALQVTGTVSVLLVIGYLALYVLVEVAQRLWLWIDDEKDHPVINQINRGILRLAGYKVEVKVSEYGSKYIKYLDSKGQEAYEGPTALYTLIACSLIPWAFYFYPVTLAGVACFLLARLARKVRRARKDRE